MLTTEQIERLTELGPVGDYRISGVSVQELATELLDLRAKLAAVRELCLKINGPIQGLLAERIEAILDKKGGDQCQIQ